MSRLLELIEELHDNAVKARYDFYIDPDTGNQVMTEQYLLERGWCCNSGCRHCPY